MPNWVTNRVTVTDPKVNKIEELENFESKSLQEFFDKITAEHPLANNIAGELSFHNLIEPDPSLWVDYDSTSIWYDWNIRNWGTKWDAKEAVIEIHTDGHEGFDLNFDTAWSPPEPIIEEFIEYCRKNSLVLEWWYEEEQGWGGEIIVALDGDVDITHWDIPSSHADYEEKDGECICEWDDDPNDWFEDCPNKAEKVKEFADAEV